MRIESYPSDITDEQWELIEPHLPVYPGGRPRTTPLRDVVDAVFYILRTGSGWKVGNLLTAVPKALAERKPEAAIIMIGTNDISGGKVPADYEAELEKVLKMCMEAKCVPILSTIPPRRGRDEAVAAANQIIRDLAGKHHIPLVDYHAAILAHAPDGKWDGTLISNDLSLPMRGINPCPCLIRCAAPSSTKS